MIVRISKSERLLLEESMRKIAPEYRMFDSAEFREALQRAKEVLRNNPKVLNATGGVSVPLLMRHVCTSLKREGYGVPFIWWWIAFELNLLRGIQSDPWSEVKWWMWNEMRGKGQVLTMWGCQNCLAPETLVRMFDGTLKRVDEVSIGDQLMGDDATPRTVRATCSGMAPMVRVTPKVGRSWICTDNHKQAVVARKGHYSARKRKIVTSEWASTGFVYDVETSELLNMQHQDRSAYGLTSACAEYPEAALQFDPYIYGLWLGDGTKVKPEITNTDQVILDEWRNYFKDHGYKVAEAGDNRRPHVIRSFVSNPVNIRKNGFLHFIRSSVNETKFIRPEYLKSSIKQRLELLAGIIDTDGHLTGGVYYTVVCSDKALMDGYEELANSLGFRTSRKQKETNYTGKNGKKHRTESLSICGDVGRIPVRLERKRKVKNPATRGTRRHGVTGFTLEPLGIGPYAGFEVDGNHHFLLADYTITVNSAKTSWMGRFSVVQMAAWLQHAQIYVSGPYKEHTDDKAWAALRNWALHMKNNRSQFIEALGLKIEVKTEEVFISNTTGSAGTAKFVALDQASSVQGKKSSEHDESGLLGVMVLIVDEFIENSQLRLKQAESNISSNFNFFGILGCNPLPEKTQHPAVMPFSAPIDVVNLNRAQHFRWRTAYGYCIRFAWLNCPNRILDRSVWNYLLVKERMSRQQSKGSDIIDAQVDAWGFGAGVRGAPLDETQIRMAGTYNEPIWQSMSTRLLMIDCAFGGQDPATGCVLEFGDVMIKDSKGNAVYKRAFSGVEQFIMPIEADFIATDEWIEEMRELMAMAGGAFPQTIDLAPVKAGDRIGGSWHLAYQTLLAKERYSIPTGNVSFDASQRGDCTNAMQDALGRNNVRWYYEGSRAIRNEEELTGDWYRWPYRYTEADEGEPRPQKWSEHCSQTSSMIWFFACEIIKHGYLLNGGTMKLGLSELCSRPISRGRRGQGEGKTDILGKEKLKEMGQKSPTYGETLAMGMYFGARFLGAISLDAPKLTVAMQPQAYEEQLNIVRSGGRRRLEQGFKKLAFGS